MENRRRLWVGIVLPALILLIFVLAPPHSLLAKSGLVGYGVCHQFPENSFQPGGVPLPLCARCSGTFLGALLGMISVWIMGRGRAAKLPPPRVLVVLVLFFMIWAADGLNSFLSSNPGFPHLYEPSNLLRLITGTMNGLTLGLVVQPLVNMVLWRDPDPRPTIPSLGALALILIPAAALVVVVAAEWAFTLYPLALASAVAVVIMLGILNGLIIVLALRRENTLEQRLSAAMPFGLWGLVFALLELAAIDLFRAWLTSALGIPV